jgi:hypothetical protein
VCSWCTLLYRLLKDLGEFVIPLALFLEVTGDELVVSHFCHLVLAVPAFGRVDSFVNSGLEV